MSAQTNKRQDLVQIVAAIPRHVLQEIVAEQLAASEAAVDAVSPNGSPWRDAKGAAEHLAMTLGAFEHQVRKGLWPRYHEGGRGYIYNVDELDEARRRRARRIPAVDEQAEEA